MKKFILTILLCVAAISGTQAQNNCKQRFSFATTIGGGYIPSEYQVLGYYNLTEHWSLGAGTGLSFLEKMLIPVFGDVKYQIGRERRFTPYVEAAAGYSFAPARTANGGLFINPSFGVQYRLNGRLKLQLAAGWETQKLERLKRQSGSYFYKEFAEKLNHNLISLRLGLYFK